MQTESLYPLLQVRDVENTARFYEQHFGFTRTYSLGWYAQLQATSEHPFELAIIAYDHDSIPEIGRKPSSGVVLSFYVADVDKEAARLEQAGIQVAQSLRSEGFGQRHIIVSDPNGILIDVITPIEPDADWLAAQQD